MALVAARADPSGMERVATALGPKPAAPSVSQRQLQRDGPWILAPGAERVSRRLRAQFPIVSDHWTPQLGVKTGADDLFLLDRACSGSRPAIRGRDVSAWRCRPRRFVLWTHGIDGLPLARLPSELSERLSRHEERLRRRADYRAGPPWQLFRTGLGFAAHRVVWPTSAVASPRRSRAAELVPLNTVYGIATRDALDAAALAALLIPAGSPRSLASSPIPRAAASAASTPRVVRGLPGTAPRGGLGRARPPRPVRRAR